MALHEYKSHKTKNIATNKKTREITKNWKFVGCYYCRCSKGGAESCFLLACYIATPVKTSHNHANTPPTNGSPTPTGEPGKNTRRICRRKTNKQKQSRRDKHANLPTKPSKVYYQVYINHSKRTSYIKNKHKEAARGPQPAARGPQLTPDINLEANKGVRQYFLGTSCERVGVINKGATNSKH